MPKNPAGLKAVLELKQILCLVVDHVTNSCASQVGKRKNLEELVNEKLLLAAGMIREEVHLRIMKYEEGKDSGPGV